jgi:predicted negative regulator of RcsB-dependent stress response
MNWLGHLFIMEKQYDKAHTLLKRNTDNYPDSPNVYDSMGEILLLEGDTTGALDNYERSLKLDPGNENAGNIIKRLKK